MGVCQRLEFDGITLIPLSIYDVIYDIPTTPEDTLL